MSEPQLLMTILFLAFIVIPIAVLVIMILHEAKRVTDERTHRIFREVK